MTQNKSKHKTIIPYPDIIHIERNLYLNNLNHINYNHMFDLACKRQRIPFPLYYFCYI